MKYYLLLIILFLLVLLRFSLLQHNPQIIDGENLHTIGTVSRHPQVQGSYQKFDVKIVSGNTISIFTKSYPSYGYGDKIDLVGKVKVKKYPDGKTIATSSFPTMRLVKRSQFSLFQMINKRISTLYKETLPDTSASLLLGIVFGQKEQMPKDFTLFLQTTGVVHVIAASGMNITMVAGFFYLFFSQFFRRQLAIVLSVLGIGFYVFLAGFEPSVLRAAIMSSIAFSAGLFGRQYNALFALLLTGCMMLLWDPLLLGNIGFQLSFFSTAGILFLKQILTFSYKGALKSLLFFTDDLGTTLAAQIATLPILLGTFGNYGLLSILVNILVLWTIPILMILGGFAALIGMVFEPFAKLLLYLSLPFLLFFEAVITFFGQMHIVFTIQSLPISITIGYYLLLIAFVLWRSKRVEKNF